MIEPNIQTNKTDSPVFEFLNSMIAANIRVELADKYKIKSEKLQALCSLVFDLALGKVNFTKLPQEASKLFSFDDATALAFARDLLGQQFLFLENYFPDFMAAFQSVGGKPEDYMEIISRIGKSLAEEKKFFSEQLTDKPFIFEPPVAEEDSFGKEEFENIFSTGLVDFLFKLKDVELIEEFNLEVILFMSDHVNAKNEFFRSLLNNQERIGNNQIIIENKKTEPTISNWLKDFIKLKGSDLFDELTLAEYLSLAPNAKILKQEDKDLLRKLLKLYRNLAFFPESQGGAEAEKWAILSIDINQEADGHPKTMTKNHQNTVRQELEESLSNFQKGSLAYRAAAEELERLNKAANQK